MIDMCLIFDILNISCLIKKDFKTNFKIYINITVSYINGNVLNIIWNSPNFVKYHLEWMWNTLNKIEIRKIKEVQRRNTRTVVELYNWNMGGIRFK